MSQQSLQPYMPSNTSDDAANVARKQNEGVVNHKRKMNLRKRKQPKFRMLADIYRETKILSIVVPEMHTITRASENNKRRKTNLNRRKRRKVRRLADINKDTKVLPSAVSNHKTASGSGQLQITEANPPSQNVVTAAQQLLEISKGVEYVIRNPICRVNKNPAEFRVSTAQRFMRSI